MVCEYPFDALASWGEDTILEPVTPGARFPLEDTEIDEKEWPWVYVVYLTKECKC